MTSILDSIIETKKKSAKEKDILAINEIGKDAKPSKKVGDDKTITMGM